MSLLYIRATAAIVARDIPFILSSSVNPAVERGSEPEDAKEFSQSNPMSSPTAKSERNQEVGPRPDSKP